MILKGTDDFSEATALSSHLSRDATALFIKNYILLAIYDAGYK